MKAIQNINGTILNYDVIKQVGEIRGKKIYQIKNTETGFICNKFEFEIEILNDL